MIARRARWDISDRSANDDSTDATLANDPIEKAEHAEPIDPIDSTDPTEPIDRMDPREPTLKIESCERYDHSDVTGTSCATRPDDAAYSGGMSLDVDRLLAEREEALQGELTELTKPAGDVGGISFGKRVGEGTSMAVDRLAAVSAQEHLLAMLEEVRRARRRVADGTYGYCEVCGSPIPQARLEFRPWAARCVDHT